jgi:hypothetical protein
MHYHSIVGKQNPNPERGVLSGRSEAAGRRAAERLLRAQNCTRGSLFKLLKKNQIGDRKTGALSIPVQKCTGFFPDANFSIPGMHVNHRI